MIEHHSKADAGDNYQFDCAQLTIPFPLISSPVIATAMLLHLRKETKQISLSLSMSYLSNMIFENKKTL